MLIRPNPQKSIFDGKKYIAWDTESYKQKDGDNVILPLCNYSIYDGENYFDGESRENFDYHVLKLLKKYKKIMLFAHNSLHDFKVMHLTNMFIEKAKYLNLEPSICLLGNVVYVKYTNEHGYSIEFLDTFNYFKSPLSNIAVEMGLEKYATKEDYNKPIDEWNDYIHEYGRELCEKDVYILYQVLKYMDNNKKLKWGLSGAQTTFKTFLDKYLDVTIDLTDFNELALKSYHGGRTEAYNLGFKNNILDLDINSIYPYVMRNNKYSYKFHKQILPSQITYIMNNIKNQTYNYLIRLDYKVIGDVERLPVLVSHDSKLMQFKEYKDVYITGLEFYQLVTDFNVDYTIIEIYEFYNRDLFSKYIDDFYKFKQNSKGFERNFYKLNLNSLYGKFGQHTANTEFSGFDNIEDLQLKELILSVKDNHERINYNGVMYSIYDNSIGYSVQKEPKYAVLIASEITANARLYNYKVQKDLGFNHVFYTDTDSFFTDLPVNSPVVQKYLDDNELGKMKIENSGNVVIKAPKDYKFTDENNNTMIKLKGIPIKKAKEISPDVYTYEQFNNLKTKSKEVIVKTVTKKVTHENTKLRFDLIGNGYVWENVTEYDNYRHNLKVKS